MPRPLARRAVALLSLLCLAGGLAACRDSDTGQARVVVIGDQPRLVDPSAGALDQGDALLTSSLAQGLVAFDAGGNIVGGLAERWNVSDDGLSYIFRLASTEWSDGRRVTADQVARALKRTISATSRNPLRDTLGAVSDVVAMTDRVIEIRLSTPRPNLLALLAQPEFAILRNRAGTGPFRLERQTDDGWLRLTRTLAADDDRDESTEILLLKGEAAAAAIADFGQGKADLVLGGTFADLPLTRGRDLPRGTLRFDPASGLFGLVPLALTGPFASPEARGLLNRAIDRASFIAALGVPGLVPRATLLEPGLDGGLAPVIPAWALLPPEQRRAEIVKEAARLFGGKDARTVRVYLPAGPGGDLLLNQLTIDWGSLGLKVERATSRRGADFALIDDVAPSASPAWFVRRFRCGTAPICDAEADEVMDSARAAPVPAQRAALLMQAAGRIDDGVLFLPISAPVRWSLVGEAIGGFRGNRFARHSLVGLKQNADSRTFR